MIIRSSANKTTKKPGVEEAEIHIPASVARKLKAYAELHDTTVEAATHEMLAVMFREAGLELLATLVEYLDAHDRPIPAGAKREPPKYGCH